MLLRAFRDVFAAYEGHPVLSSMLMPRPRPWLSALFSGSQPTRRQDQTRGGGDLSDWSQTLFHLFSAMPAHTLMLHFPPRTGGGSLHKESFLSEPSVCLSLLFNSALTGSSLIEIQIKINLLSYALEFYMHLFPLMHGSKYVFISAFPPRRSRGSCKLRDCLSRVFPT